MAKRNKFSGPQTERRKKQKHEQLTMLRTLRASEISCLFVLPLKDYLPKMWEIYDFFIIRRDTHAHRVCAFVRVYEPVHVCDCVILSFFSVVRCASFRVVFCLYPIHFHVARHTMPISIYTNGCVLVCASGRLYDWSNTPTPISPIITHISVFAFPFIHHIGLATS